MKNVDSIPMSILTHFQTAATLNSGFAVEQYLNRFGFFELGRRTNAAAWTSYGDDKVIRISEDATGSEEFFKMAIEMEGNPYLPVVFGQATLPSGDHIACVEKLESPAHKTLYAKNKEIKEKMAQSILLDPEEVIWKSEYETCGVTAAKISNIFMSKTYNLDVDAFPNPEAFMNASVAMLELTEKVNAVDSRFVPGPDMNPTNILFRRTGAGIQPVLYDPLIKQNHTNVEREHTDAIREKFGLPPMGKIAAGPV